MTFPVSVSSAAAVRSAWLGAISGARTRSGMDGAIRPPGAIRGSTSACSANSLAPIGRRHHARREADRSPHACAADGAATRRTAAGRVRSPRSRVRPRRSIASRYVLSAASPARGQRSADGRERGRCRLRVVEQHAGPPARGHASAAAPAGCAPRPTRSSCMSSITSQSRSSSRTRSVSSRSVIAHPFRSGAAVTPHQSRPRGRLAQRAQQRHPEPLRSRSCRPTGTHAALSARSASPAHDRSKTVFPLPGGADATVTRADASSRLNSPGRDTTPPAPGQVTRPATASDARAAPMARSSHKAGWHPNRRAVRSISAATDRRSLSSSASSTRRSGLAGLGQRRLPLAGWLASSPRSTAGRRSGRGSRASC